MSDTTQTVNREDFVQPSLLVPAMRRDLSQRAIESVHARVEDIDVSAVITADYDHVPASVLPALAEETGLLGDAGWDYAGFGPSPEAKKRKLLKQAVPLQAKRGTRGAVEDALAALNVSSNITEWWQDSPPAQPYTFRIDLLLSEMTENEQPVLSKARFDTLIKTVAYWKNVRSVFTVRMGLDCANQLRVANAYQQLQVMRRALDMAQVLPDFVNELQLVGVLSRPLHVSRLSLEL
ncbi:MAG: phage tail protein I [Burkholderiaceae bacterium]